MFRSRLLGFTALAALVLAAPAAAKPKKVKHSEVCVGELTAVYFDPAPTMEILGNGVATTLGVYQIEGGHTFDPATGDLSGAFTSTAADGATLSGTYAGVFYPIAPDVFVFEVHVSYTAGTGRLAGWTGEADTQALLFGAGPGSPFVYVTEGYLTEP